MGRAACHELAGHAPKPARHPPAGKTEKREHLLDERDSLFVDLRHQHFAAASMRISGMMDEFRDRNKARGGGLCARARERVCVCVRVCACGG